MYRRTKRQVSLLDPADSLPDGALHRLRASWGERFQSEVYPVLLGVEDEFRDLYGEEGRRGKGGSSGDDGKIEIHKPNNPAQSLQSPHDPDAGYGYKGVGYEVQIVETCNNSGTELIVDFAVQRSGDTDHGQAAAALDRLRDGGIAPDTVFVDGGYISPEALLDAEARSVELHGPVARGPLPPEIIGRDAWTTDPSTGLLHTCPAGHTVQRHAERTNLSKKVRTHAYMDGNHRRSCPLRTQCLVRAPNSGKAGAFTDGLGVPGQAARVDDRGTRSGAPRE